MTRLSPLLLGLVLAACGGGGGDSVTPAVPTSGADAAPPSSVIASPAPDTSPSDAGSIDGFASSASAPSTGASAAATGTAVAETGTMVDVPDLAMSETAAAAPAAKAADTAPAVTVYVSPDGNDAWSGNLAAANGSQTDGPVKTLTRAQAVARTKVAAMNAGTAARMAVHVDVYPGTYALSAPLAYNDLDSGIAGYPVIWEATSPGNVLISGGVTLVPGANTATQAKFTMPVGAPATDWNAAQQLFVNGRRATLARTPNEGSYFFVDRAVTLPGETAAIAGTSAFTTNSSAQRLLSTLNTEDQSRAVLNVYQSWTTGRHRLAQSTYANTVQITPMAKWPFRAYGPDQRYFVENISTALDAPGEFFGTSAGVTYLPRADETPASVTAVLPVLENLINVTKNGVTGKNAQYLEFHGFRFEHTRMLTPSTGVTDSQAAVHVDAAINVDYGTNLVFDNCKFAHLGGFALWLRTDARNITASNNTMTDLGAGGVKIGMAVAPLNDPAPTANDTIINNAITDTGHIMPGAVGVWIGQTFGHTVTKNVIANTTYSAISVGWTWGFGTATSGNNTISNNLLFNIGQGVLSDVGGIYAVGAAPGTKITGNLIREVRAFTGYGPGAWGIYNDLGTTGVVTDSNVVIGTDSGSYLLTQGHSNTVTNNLFANGDLSEFGVSISDPLTNLQSASNLFVPLNTQPFANYAMSPNVSYSSNTASTASVTPDLSKCATGCTTSATKVKVGAAPKSISLTSAPAAIAAVAQATIKNAGPTNTAMFKSLKVATQKPVAPISPPWPYSLDIASAAPGTQPLGMVYFPAGDYNALKVVNKTGATDNGKCLQFADAPSLANLYDPHTYSKLNHYMGTSTLTFHAYIDSAAQFFHEWRDTAVPYNSGPSLSLSAKGVTVGGQVILPLKVNAWSTIEITAATGSGAGKWNLKVTDADGTVHSASNLANVSPAWRSFYQAYFISNANVVTNSCISGFTVTSSAT